MTVHAARGRRLGPWRTAFDIQGHRGARGHVAESTWPSFVRAGHLGATTIEFDVRLTADGEAVIWHDATLQRADPQTDERLRTAWIADLPSGDVLATRVSPAGDRVMRLRDALGSMRAGLPGTWANVEVKVDHHVPGAPIVRDRLVDVVLADIAAAGMADRAIVHSFDWAVLVRAAQRAPQLPRSALVESRTLQPGTPWLAGSDPSGWTGPSEVVATAASIGADALCPNRQWPADGNPVAPQGYLDRPLLAAAHEAGMPVVPWTVNDPEQIARLLRIGVDGLVSDYPDRVVSALSDMGAAAQPPTWPDGQNLCRRHRKDKVEACCASV